VVSPRILAAILLPTLALVGCSSQTRAAVPVQSTGTSIARDSPAVGPSPTSATPTLTPVPAGRPIVPAQATPSRSPSASAVAASGFTPRPVTGLAPLTANRATSPPDGWQSYANPSAGYVLSYPGGWLERFGAGSSADARYFASADVQAPLEMTPDAAWLSVLVTSVSQSTCLQPPSGVVTYKSRTSLGGSSAMAYRAGPIKGGVEPTWKQSAATYRDGRCYQVLIVTLNQATEESEVATMAGIVAGFRFS
jgi:hypothetical protein